MRTAIITDSNSGIFEAEARALGIYSVPMPVILNQMIYFEGQSLTHESFYGMLRDRASVSTSQPAPESVTAVWDRALAADGFDEAVYIPMSSGLSASFQTASVLAEDYGGRVHVVDNHRISVTLRHAVLDAMALAERGCSGALIKARLEEAAYLSLVYVGVQDLEFLRRGGRITPAAQTMGALLNLKPLLVIQGDKLDAYAKVRGIRQCQQREIAAMKQYADRLKSQGHTVRVSAAGSYASQEDAAAWLHMVQDAFPEDEVNYDPLTFSIGCHVGPDAFGMGVSAVL